ncbi:MAG: hypothetical protein ACK518_04080 [bacterium]
MEMTNDFEKFYKECDVLKEIREHSIILQDDKPSIRVIKDESFEDVIKLLMLKSFARGAEFSLQMMKKITKFDEKLAQA